jgi:hypothetical protein
MGAPMKAKGAAAQLRPFFNDIDYLVSVGSNSQE